MSDAPAEQQPQETPSHPENAAYPEALRCREEELIAHRRGNTEGRCEPRVGLALSGGGIRSATFSFGFLQALARRKVLKEVDVLSTVSGGGYTGGMLTRLCSRHEVGSPEDVARAILPEGATPGEAEQARKGNDGSPTRSIRSGAVLRWLRENGHHLAPNGAGDLLLSGAVIFRNWLSLHVVLGTLLLTVFVAMQLGRFGVRYGGARCAFLHFRRAGGDGLAHGSSRLWHPARPALHVVEPVARPSRPAVRLVARAVRPCLLADGESKSCTVLERADGFRCACRPGLRVLAAF